MQVDPRDITFPPFLWYIVPGLNCIVIILFLPIALIHPPLLKEIASIGGVAIVFVFALVTGFIMASFKLYGVVTFLRTVRPLILVV